jgi:hypothetical protein
MVWQTVERQPGYFGKRRDQVHRGYDERYGPGEWRIAFELGEGTVGLEWMLQIYEDAYFLFLLAQPEVLGRLVSEASEVFDDDIRNIESGCDYSIQQTGLNHYHDIALRRCLMRLGRRFRGASPIQIRDWKGDHSLSLELSPGWVPFQFPEWVTAPLAGWWEPGSVEEAYQSLKVVQIMKH